MDYYAFDGYDVLAITVQSRHDHLILIWSCTHVDCNMGRLQATLQKLQSQKFRTALHLGGRQRKCVPFAIYNYRNAIKSDLVLSFSSDE